MPGPNLRFTDVARRYGRLTVLTGVSGEVGAGEVLLVTGPNGSGKSTLLRCLAGLLAPDAGTIEYREEAGGGGPAPHGSAGSPPPATAGSAPPGAAGSPPHGSAGSPPRGADGSPPRGFTGSPPLDAAGRRRAIGYVAPDLAFYEELTTAENLAFFARLRGVPAERGPRLLDRLALPHDRAAGALSSGMRQKLRWCWSLLHRPRLLLLDEPFQNLDAGGEADVRRLLVEHLDSGGLAVLAQPVEPPIDRDWRVARHVTLAG